MSTPPQGPTYYTPKFGLPDYGTSNKAVEQASTEETPSRSWRAPGVGAGRLAWDHPVQPDRGSPYPWEIEREPEQWEIPTPRLKALRQAATEPAPREALEELTQATPDDDRLARGAHAQARQSQTARPQITAPQTNRSEGGRATEPQWQTDPRPQWQIDPRKSRQGNPKQGRPDPEQERRADQHRPRGNDQRSAYQPGTNARPTPPRSAAEALDQAAQRAAVARGETWAPPTGEPVAPQRTIEVSRESVSAIDNARRSSGTQRLKNRPPVFSLVAVGITLIEPGAILLPLIAVIYIFSTAKNYERPGVQIAWGIAVLVLTFAALIFRLTRWL